MTDDDMIVKPLTKREQLAAGVRSTSESSGAFASLAIGVDVPTMVPHIGVTAEHVVRLSPAPEWVLGAAEGATFTIEYDGWRYVSVPARLVDGAVEFLLLRAAWRERIAGEEPQG